MESLNIFIRSIFIDNMVFAFFFGIHRRIEERQDGPRPGSGRYVRDGDDRASELPFVRIRPQSRCIGPGSRFELFDFHRLYRHDRRFRAARGDGRREILADAL